MVSVQDRIFTSPLRTQNKLSSHLTFNTPVSNFEKLSFFSPERSRLPSNPASPNLAYNSPESSGDFLKRGRPKAAMIHTLINKGYSVDSSIRCSHCSRVFPREKSLAAHMRTHTGEKPYICDYPSCFKAFCQSGQLKTHQRLHSGEKPFVCSAKNCNTRFTHSNRHCPDHPNASLSRDERHMPLQEGECSRDVKEWLKRYYSSRHDRTPYKHRVSSPPTTTTKRSLFGSPEMIHERENTMPSDTTTSTTTHTFHSNTTTTTTSTTPSSSNTFLSHDPPPSLLSLHSHSINDIINGDYSKRRNSRGSADDSSHGGGGSSHFSSDSASNGFISGSDLNNNCYNTSNNNSSFYNNNNKKNNNHLLTTDLHVTPLDIPLTSEIFEDIQASPYNYSTHNNNYSTHNNNYSTHNNNNYLNNNNISNNASALLQNEININNTPQQQVSIPFPDNIDTNLNNVEFLLNNYDDLLNNNCNNNNNGDNNIITDDSTNLREEVVECLKDHDTFKGAMALLELANGFAPSQ